MTSTADNNGPKKVGVTCKKCGKHFDRLEWMTNKICENPDCNCPEIKKAMEAANTAIAKARRSSTNSIKITTSSIPTNRDESKDQLEVKIAPITVIDVIPPKKGK